jgi:hypothetical protein
MSTSNHPDSTFHLGSPVSRVKADPESLRPPNNVNWLIIPSAWHFIIYRTLSRRIIHLPRRSQKCHQSYGSPQLHLLLTGHQILVHLAHRLPRFPQLLPHHPRSHAVLISTRRRLETVSRRRKVLALQNVSALPDLQFYMFQTIPSVCYNT